MTSAPDPENDSPRSKRRKTWSPGLIWAIPLAALIIVAYLGIQAFIHRGEVVTVTFRRAAGARPGETKVLYQGVEAGQLIKIVPNEDGRRLDFQLRLVPQAKAGLNSNALFWLIGASPTFADLSSLRAVVSGIAIGYAPGEGGTAQTRFEGLDRAPIVLPGDKGTRYLLTAQRLGSINEGSVLLYHGQLVGKVTEVKFNGEAGFLLEVFVFAPYDSLVKPGVRFWKSIPLRMSLAGGGLNVTVAPITTILAGGIDVELPAAGADAPQSKPESEFKLYASRSAAREGLSGPTVRYDFTFDGAAGGLDEEAAVTLLGFQIGEIETAQLTYDKRTERPYTLVTALLYPQRLNVTVPSAGSNGDWQSATDAKLRGLVRKGYRARLQQTPPLVGNQSIALVEVKGAIAADLAHDSPNPRIPSAPGSTGLDGITAQADQILAKINHIPIEQIGRDLQEVTSRLRGLVTSPKMEESLAHLNHTLAELDQMVGDVEPRIGPLVTELNQAAAQITATALATHQLLDSDGAGQGDSLTQTLQQLNEAARSIRTLADYLGRHPEALIRGKRPEK
ncbi:MAG: paraquat-inducible protein [Gammaproteobacteria bacterium]|jgi:paraquat-inducible protein B|nr:paraquat-inducible protein [Gammaproteobacteria bacterium]